jgi:thiosulfate/3-mercaptopyruvate sulfurtransferase
MPHTRISPLITASELAQRLGQPDLRIVDASWWLDGRDARADYEVERLPGAIFFDIDAISDKTSPYPHMLPATEDFAVAVGDLGIGTTDEIVVYDAQGLFSAARVWWTFMTMGADRVRVLDGGLPQWRAEGFNIETGPASAPAKARFHPRFDASRVANTQDVMTALDQGQTILDARGAPRFEGKIPEPRPGLRSGHMPGALNLPFGHLIEADGKMKRGDALKAVYETASYRLGDPVITSCGSGVTAAILTLGLAELGHSARLYDGSWAEWGSREDTPIVQS